jgi:protoporphyrinogen oxidase
MDVQYGIDNPMFLDFKKNQEYMVKKVVPWMIKYVFTAPKIAKLNVPVLEYLKKYSQNQSLLDIIAQHFFQETPSFFALSYVKLYLDYYYPLGGTGVIISKLMDFITDNHGEIRTNTKIIGVNTEKKFVEDTEGNEHHYRRLIWAADQHLLYKLINPDKISDPDTKNGIIERKALILEKSGNDSVYTVFLGVNIAPDYFANRCSEHFFYTPDRTGQSAAGSIPINQNQQTTEKWLEKFFKLTTYEISIPVLRDSTMAPPGKTGLIVRLLNQ